MNGIGFWTRLWWWITRSLGHMVAAGLAVVVVLAGIGFAIYRLAQPPSLSCGSPGVSRPTPESRQCVGVTDGRYDFSASLRPIDRLIEAENDRVGTGPGVATLAVLLPMTGTDTPIAVHSLEGAYTAQYRANHLSSEAPKVRLLIANPGSASQYWSPVVRKLRAMTGAPDNLRAVTGISVSTKNTRDEVRWLTHHGVPVVSSTTTAEDIANPGDGDTLFPGLARMAPDNEDAARALGHVSRIDPKRALVVEDTRTDDDYITSLKAVFHNLAKDAPYQPFQYISPRNVTADGATENQFAQEAPNICQEAPRYIFFAGRHVQLRQFLNELGKRCATGTFTVIGGADARRVLNDTKLDRDVFRANRITLEYPAMATPMAWEGSALDQTGEYVAGYRAFQDAMRKAFPAGRVPTAAELADGEAMLSHDAVWTAHQALATLIGVERDPSGHLPSTGDLATEWRQLRGGSRIEGASGWICLDNGGNPWNKAVSIVRLDQTGPHFQQLAWPEGRAPGATCSA